MAGLGETILVQGDCEKRNSQSIPDFTLFINLIIFSAAATGVTWSPYEEDSDGNWIPTVVFKAHASLFHAFVLFIMFGFTASFSGLLSYNRPKVARVFRSCSVICLSCAAAVFLHASFSVRWVFWLSCASAVLLYAAVLLLASDRWLIPEWKDRSRNLIKR